MKVVIVTHSSTYEARAGAIKEYCSRLGYETLCVFSDFDHHAHKVRTEERKEDVVYLPLKPYRKNLSVRRMKSIYDFSLEAERYLAEIEFDILYVMVPANSLAAMAQRLKSRKDFRLIMDIMDLWPEALPLEKAGWLPPVRYWKWLRDKSLSSADTVITECNYYRQFLNVPDEKVRTLYWVDPSTAEESDAGRETQIIQNAAPLGEADQASEQTGEEQTSEEMQNSGTGKAADADVRHPENDQELQLSYIGAINNIIDIDGISGLLAELGKLTRFRLHVVGDGEHRKDFLKALRDKNIKYVYYGKIYDADRKKEILDKCDFGINMMKKGVTVGLTMKSVDYLAHGIPLINNIPGDTWEMMEEGNAGINVGRGKNAFEKAAREIAESRKNIEQLRRSAIFLYRNRFTKEAFEDTLREILK